jgi:hypothetical protein
LSYARFEEIEHAASDEGIIITPRTSKCDDELRVKYLLTKAICKYFDMNGPQNKLSAP